MFAGTMHWESEVSHEMPLASGHDMLAMFAASGRETTWRQGRFCFVGMLGDASAVSFYNSEDLGLSVLVWGRLDNLSDLTGVLGSADRRFSFAEMLAHAWLRWGEQCVAKLVGDFAFAIADHKSGTLFLARDPLGVKPLYYQTDAAGLRFAASAAAIKAMRPAKLTRSRQWLAEYLLDLSWSHASTAYEEIHKLPAAHCLRVDADGHCQIRRYHRFVNDAPAASRRDPDYLEAYRETWLKAVHCRMPAQGNIGTENSGGLDSGSITAELARTLGTDSDRLFSMGFCKEALEPEYIMATAMQYQLRNTVLFSHNVSRDWPKIRARELQVNGYPQEHVNASSHFPFYEYCVEQGISRLFSGFGGDEVVTNPVGLTARFELFDRRDWPALWRILPGGIIGRSARFARNILRATAPMPMQNALMLAAFRDRWPYQFLTAEAVQFYGLDRTYFDSATYDERFRNLNEAAIYLIGRPFAATRLENCSLMAASFGIEYAWPLLDQRLIQQWLSTPVIWKVGDYGIGRYLHRRAVTGVCPDLVAWKQNKDMGFAGSVRKMQEADNRPVLRRLLELLQALPSEIESLIDTPRLVAFANAAIKQDLRGEVLNYALVENTDRLETLVEWLSADGMG